MQEMRNAKTGLILAADSYGQHVKFFGEKRGVKKGAVNCVLGIFSPGFTFVLLGTGLTFYDHDEVGILARSNDELWLSSAIAGLGCVLQEFVDTGRVTALFFYGYATVGSVVPMPAKAPLNHVLGFSLVHRFTALMRALRGVFQ